jgi:two-component system, OmpR family, response regulator RegX3
VPKVLLIEDEEGFGQALEYQLGREGYDVDRVTDGSEGLERFKTNGADLVLLDLMLPGMAGEDVCREIRRFSSVPIIMLTARDTEIDKVVGLEIGADDYVTKPFSMDELVGRIRALLRRRELDRRGPDGGVAAAGIEIDAYRHRVVVDGEQRNLTPSEFKVLSLLASEPGRVFTRREIMQHLWDSRYVGDQRACDIHVSNLRGKLGAERIETVRGVGYRLTTV